MTTHDDNKNNNTQKVSSSSSTTTTKQLNHEEEAGVVGGGPKDDEESNNAYNRNSNDEGTTTAAALASSTMFPWKIHLMLNDVEAANKDDVVSWLPSGVSTFVLMLFCVSMLDDVCNYPFFHNSQIYLPTFSCPSRFFFSKTNEKTAFRIHNKERFANEIMPKYFSSNKFKSFQRSLNLWGFQTETKEPRKGAISQQYFMRNQPDLCHMMRRVKVRTTRHNDARDSMTTESRISLLKAPPAPATPQQQGAAPSDMMVDSSPSSSQVCQQQMQQMQQQLGQQVSPSNYYSSSSSPLSSAAAAILAASLNPQDANNSPSNLSLEQVIQRAMEISSRHGTDGSTRLNQTHQQKIPTDLIMTLMNRSEASAPIRASASSSTLRPADTPAGGGVPTGSAAGPSSIGGRLEQILLQLNPTATAASQAHLRHQQQQQQQQQQRESMASASSSLVASILQQQQQGLSLGIGSSISNHAILRKLLLQELEAAELRKALVAAAVAREQQQQQQQRQQNALTLELAYALLGRNGNNSGL
jgi:hypothetical protein